MLNLRMYTVILQTHVIQFLLALLPAMVSSTLHYEHSYAPAHEYKNHDYSFSYGVKDLHSGDVKQQWEKKEGDTVKGSYSLIEPDGRVRIVDYHADKENGFTATVKHKGVAKHPVDKHAQGYSADHEDDKPISHNEFNIKPGTPVVHYNHATTNSEDTSSYYAKDTHDPAKYEIKYFYPSEVKKYQEALAAQQQYYQSRDAHPVTEEQEEGGDEQEQEEGEQHGNESQEKQVHYYIPQTFESNEGKSEKNTNIPQAYLDASETQLQPQSIPLDLTYVKHAGSAQTPIGVNLLNSFRQTSSYQQPRTPSVTTSKLNKDENSQKFLKDVYAAIKNAYDFSPPQLENGFKPLGKKVEESSAVKITPASTSLGLGQYSNLNVGEVTKFTSATPSKEQKLYYLPSFYESAKNLRTQNIHNTFKSRSSRHGRPTGRVGKAPRNLKPK